MQCSCCKSVNIKHDYKRAEIYCNECGLVLISPLMESTAPLTASSPSYNKKWGRKRKK